MAEPDAAGISAAVLDLDRTDDKDFALVAATAATTGRVVFAVADDWCFVDFDAAGKRATVQQMDCAGLRRTCPILNPKT